MNATKTSLTAHCLSLLCGYILLASVPSVALADVAPPIGYIEKCTVKKQQKADEVCRWCRTYFRKPKACQKRFKTTVFKKRCRKGGASVWSELWCAPKKAIKQKAATKEQKSSTGKVDHSKPVEVLRTVFRAARSNDTSLLAGLCDPKGENDGDTRRLCKATSKSPRWKMFKKFFEKGSTKGTVKFVKGKAYIPFMFGPNGKKGETMVLIKRDGKWYLYSF